MGTYHDVGCQYFRHISWFLCPLSRDYDLYAQDGSFFFFSILGSTAFPVFSAFFLFSLTNCMHKMCHFPERMFFRVDRGVRCKLTLGSQSQAKGGAINSEVSG